MKHIEIIIRITPETPGMDKVNFSMATVADDGALGKRTHKVFTIHTLSLPTFLQELYKAVNDAEIRA